MRQIILDTETTGLSVEHGHRVIEIACVEMINRKLTNNHFHYYINPEREIEAAAIAVHGISNESLKDKPLFASLAKEFIEFISGAELIIHNAPFDISFLNYELGLTGHGWKTIHDYCGVIDTLHMARQMHVGQRNSLDALCKRYNVDNSKRDLHGALIDCHLLAQVYLAMTGGQGSFFDAITENQQQQQIAQQENGAIFSAGQHNLMVLKANTEEISEHKKYLALINKKVKSVWQEEAELELESV